MSEKIGVIEGFFGPEWSQSDRLSYAPFIQSTGGGFYLYAPKRDSYLRRKWRDTWSSQYISFLNEMASHFMSHGVEFGVGLSPFELGHTLNENDKHILSEKLNTLESMGVKILGVFFDDMPSDQFLAQAQKKCIEYIKNNFSGKIIFCPSYYTPDPILVKVFGEMPKDYWEEISAISSEVAMAWTGPKVISETISRDDMDMAHSILKRAPFLWENVFANDGPRNCKYLKLKPFSGRESGVFGKVEAIAFNMMNQAQLSKILFLSSRFVIEDNLDPEVSFTKALQQLCSPGFAQFLASNKKLYLLEGLDKISPEIKSDHLKQLSQFSDLQANEVSSWLKGDYIVGPECLTD